MGTFYEDEMLMRAKQKELLWEADRARLVLAALAVKERQPSTLSTSFAWLAAWLKAVDLHETARSQPVSSKISIKTTV